MKTSTAWYIRIATCFVVSFFTVLCFVLGLGLAQAEAGPGDRSYVSGNYMLEIDGVKVGFIKSFKGGNVTAEVINEAVGPDYVVRKHLGKPKYEDIEIQIGLSMGKPVYDWIAASLTNNYQRKKGAIISTNHKMEENSRIEFFEALITEVTIPACDGGSKEPAYIKLKISPEWTRTVKGSGQKSSGNFDAKSQQKLWLPSNFRLNIGGLDKACSKVNKIEAITIKQSAVQDDIGDARDQQKEPGKIEFPNISITTSEAVAEQLEKWHEEFVIKGNNDQTQEKNGVLEILSTHRKDVLLKLEFSNLGIFRLTADSAPNDVIKRVKAEMYVEQIKLSIPQAKIAGSKPTSSSPAAMPLSLKQANKPVLLKTTIKK